PDAGSVALVQTDPAPPAVLDSINYRSVSADHSFGDAPDGNPLHRRVFFHATPGGANDPSVAPYPVFINEGMADNQRTLADPADGAYEDWFELYNPNHLAVDLP